MFAAIQNNKITYCVENETLCEALARGFQSIEELREWENGLPKDNWDRPILPDAPFEIRRLAGALLEEYQNLEREGYRPGEIRLRQPAEVAVDSVATDFADDTADTDASESSMQSVKSAAASLLVPETNALERRKTRAAWDAIRERRNELLDKSDKYMMPDFPLADDKRAKWREYREALRNITNSAGLPDAVEWPQPPE